MKVLILSDLHGNLEGLEAITEPWDELWVLGDLVNYGPNPAEVVDVVRRRVVNPGIVGQPKQGFPQACYAVWEDRRLRLESPPY